jgi:hypothetical protein
LVNSTDRTQPHIWQLELDPIESLLENSVHYDVDTDQGAAEWNATLPSGGVTVHLGASAEPYTVAMFHELRCLNILREIFREYYADDAEDAQLPRAHLANHCMNYLRQMVMCRTDTRLQTVRASRGGGRTVLDVTRQCRDWTKVYEAAEENYADFLAEQ